jgi:hypothetical protein
MTPEFTAFPKMARLSRECVITEKIDGTNASVMIAELANDAPIPARSFGVFDIGGKLHYMLAGSRTRWIDPYNDNHGFAEWVAWNFEKLKDLGPGHHFGEWWGQGVNRNYGMKEKRFSLFNVDRWCRHDETPQVVGESRSEELRVMVPKVQTPAPACCHVVPVLYRGNFCSIEVANTLYDLECNGSSAAPGFMDPEGIIVYHIPGRVGFKKTIVGDDKPKGAKS